MQQTNQQLTRYMHRKMDSPLERTSKAVSKHWSLFDRGIISRTGTKKRLNTLLDMQYAAHFNEFMKGFSHAANR